MSRLTRYIQAIRQQYPDLTLADPELDDGGQYNHVLIARIDDGEPVIFRFPRAPGVASQLAVETALLRALQGRLPLPIPNPLYADLAAAPDGPLFVGYRRIPGRQVSLHTLEEGYDAPNVQRLADQLAGFLRALHGTPPDVLPAELPDWGGQDAWADFYERVQEELFDEMRPEAQREVSRHFEHFLAVPAHFDYVPTLIHGDFGPGNLLFDADVPTFTGVIDFGSAGWGDPAVDFAAVYGFRGRGEAFMRRMLRLYPTMEAAMPRIRFYAGTFALQEALYGAEHNDPGSLKRGLAPYV